MDVRVDGSVEGVERTGHRRVVVVAMLSFLVCMGGFSSAWIPRSTYSKPLKYLRN